METLFLVHQTYQHVKGPDSGPRDSRARTEELSRKVFHSCGIKSSLGHMGRSVQHDTNVPHDVRRLEPQGEREKQIPVSCDRDSLCPASAWPFPIHRACPEYLDTGLKMGYSWPPPGSGGR